MHEPRFPYATCGSFEPHEWKRAICRNCFCSLLAHELHEGRTTTAPLPHIAPRTKPDRVSERPKQKETTRTPATGSASAEDDPKARPAKPGPARPSPVPAIKLSRDESSSGGGEALDAEARLHVAEELTATLRRKVERKNGRLKETEEVVRTLRERLDTLLKEAAAMEQTQKQLREEQMRAWEREREFWQQETANAKKMARSNTFIQKQESTLETAAVQQLPQATESSKYDEQLVKKCQSIVRSWLARKRCSRLIALVSAYTVSPLAKSQRRRFATIRELIQTERNYVEMLQHANEHFMVPLRDFAEFEAKSFSPEDVETLFNNMELLTVISQQFLQALEQRFASQDNFTCYADIILKFQLVLPLYSVYYRKYEDTSELLMRLNENEEFTQFVEARQKSSKYNSMLTLKIYLYRPCQRIPQYGLLLKQLLSYTPEEHIDYANILVAVDRVQTILALLNRRTQVEQSKRKMLELQNKLLGYDKNLMDDRKRQFVDEDEWVRLRNVHSDPSNTRKLAGAKTLRARVWTTLDTKNTNQGGTVRARGVHVFVLSDMLLFAKSLNNGAYRYKFSVPLGGAVITEMQDSKVLGDGYDNPLLIKAKGCPDRFFIFPDAATRRKWTTKLWSMILVLSEDGKIKPEVRRSLYRAQHMRLTHIGMANLMKAALGNDPGEVLELPEETPAELDVLELARFRSGSGSGLGLSDAEGAVPGQSPRSSMESGRDDGGGGGGGESATTLRSMVSDDAKEDEAEVEKEVEKEIESEEDRHPRQPESSSGKASSEDPSKEKERKQKKLEEELANLELNRAKDEEYRERRRRRQERERREKDDSSDKKKGASSESSSGRSSKTREKESSSSSSKKKPSRPLKDKLEPSSDSSDDDGDDLDLFEFKKKAKQGSSVWTGPAPSSSSSRSKNTSGERSGRSAPSPSSTSSSSASSSSTSTRPSRSPRSKSSQSLKNAALIQTDKGPRSSAGTSSSSSAKSPRESWTSSPSPSSSSSSKKKSTDRATSSRRIGEMGSSAPTGGRARSNSDEGSRIIPVIITTTIAASATTTTTKTTATALLASESAATGGTNPRVHKLRSISAEELSSSNDEDEGEPVKARKKEKEVSSNSGGDKKSLRSSSKHVERAKHVRK